MQSLLNRLNALLDSRWGPHVAIAVIVLIACIIAVGSIFLLGKNNPVEKIAEQVIKIETGQDVNLSDQFP